MYIASPNTTSPPAQRHGSASIRAIGLVTATTDWESMLLVADLVLNHPVRQDRAGAMVQTVGHSWPAAYGPVRRSRPRGMELQPEPGKYASSRHDEAIAIAAPDIPGCENRVHS